MKTPASPEIHGSGSAGSPVENDRAIHVSRREFIKGAGAAVAATTLAAPRPFAADTSPRKVRVGVVGGGFGTSFQFHEHPDCIVEAVSDLLPERRERLVQAYSCEKVYNSLEELVLDPKIDAVAIFTEAPNHVKHTVEAMKHGKHVLSAVPACFATIEEAEQLRDTVKKYGLSYMMAETSYYQQHTISARRYQEEGAFGEIFYCQSEYQHSGLESLFFFPDGRRTWRHGLAPMHYPTHCVAHLVGVTGERLTEVVCHGWGDDDPILKDNAYNNPFANESAMFRTDRGHGFRVNVWWKGAHRGCERADWYGTDLSFHAAPANDPGSGWKVIHDPSRRVERDDAGFVRAKPESETVEPVEWWTTDMLPEPLRHPSGHEGSHVFLTHEFIDALAHDRKPAVDVYEALAYTVPGIVAHRSALQNGALLKIPQFDPPTKS